MVAVYTSEAKMDIKLKPQYGVYKPVKSHHAGDNTMYWGILSHDKAGYSFRNNYKSLGQMAEHLSKVAPPK